MSVNIITNTSTLLSETVTTSMVITRTVNADCSVYYTATILYGTHTFAVDANNNLTSVISLNQDPGIIGMDATAVGALFQTALLKTDSTPTCLGEVMADLMDAQIAIALGISTKTT